MEEFIKKLTLELLSQPLIFIFVIIGSLGLIYSMIKNAKSYVIYIVLIWFIISLTGGLGKNIQNISFILVLIIIVIYVMFFILIKNKKHKSSDKINEKIGDYTKENVCPKCGGTLVERTGKYGKFIGCSNYPKCKHTENINKN